ncbi:uncharacterized protein TNCV_3683291 [Trichonephila clavipes]|nr:uncharacterized protein TNCV_3683291 [Trichonephila clavipes]
MKFGTNSRRSSPTQCTKLQGKRQQSYFRAKSLLPHFSLSVSKPVMVTDGAEFVCGSIEKLFREARQNTRLQHEKWVYYNRRRCKVNIKINDLVLIQTHPMSSASKKVVAKFNLMFEGPYRVLSV